MYHQPSKRKQLIRRIASYGFMSLAVVVLVTVLVFVMLGYRYNGNDGKIEQGGLVQFDSQPNGANVTIDGKLFSTRTPSKSTLTSGSHAITIGRSGYNTWEKTVGVVPGSVLWLNYARLVPTNLPTENVADFSTVSSTSVSTDNKWMAIKEKPETPEITLADISSDKITTAKLSIPADLYTQPAQGKTQSFSLSDWDAGSRYLIVKHIYNGNQAEWLVVDTRDASLTKNVTKLLDIDAAKLVFSGNDSNILYAQIGSDVRKINMSAATLSRPLVSHVAEFSIFDQTTIVYTTSFDATTKTRSVGYYKDGDPTSYVIRSFNDDGKKQLHIALGRYFGDMYEAVAYGDTVTVLRGDLPTTPTQAAKLKELATATIKGGAKYLSIKTEGRFIVAQNGATYTTYDLELKKETTTKLKGSAAVTKKLEWIDGYMLWSDQNGTLRLYEFDGANQHDIMPVAPGYEVTLSPSEKYLYGIVKDGAAYHLERVQMILS
jgi:hypothetical protein